MYQFFFRTSGCGLLRSAQHAQSTQLPLLPPHWGRRGVSERKAREQVKNPSAGAESNTGPAIPLWHSRLRRLNRLLQPDRAYQCFGKAILAGSLICRFYSNIHFLKAACQLNKYVLEEKHSPEKIKCSQKSSNIFLSNSSKWNSILFKTINDKQTK